MSENSDQDTFLDLMRNGFFDPEEVERVRRDTAVDHFVGLVLDGKGVVETDQDRESCRAEAAEDIAMLLGCSEEYAQALVAHIEDGISWERVIDGEA